MNNSPSDKKIMIAGHSSGFLAEAYNLLNPLFPQAVFVKHTGAALAALEQEKYEIVVASAVLFDRNCEPDFSELFKSVAEQNIHLIAVSSPEDILAKINSRIKPRQLVMQGNLPVEKRAGFSSLEKIMDTLPFMSFILSTAREVLFCNKSALDFLNHNKSGELYGLKPGDILGCIHHLEGQKSCGNNAVCQFCGINKAVRTAIESGDKCSSETSLTLETDSGQISLNLRAEVNILTVAGQQVIVLYLEDISDLKRRRELERIFFHDLINTAGGIKTLVDYLVEDEDDPAEIKSLLKIIGNSSTQLLEEIRSQKDLAAAEHNELQTSFSRLNSLKIIQQAVDAYSYHQSAAGKSIVIAENSLPVDFYSDEVLLNRILGNLLKNALEASHKGDEVTVGSMVKDDEIIFYVKNLQLIAADIQHQIVQRSFSTKGHNRGIGTYSIKLLTEKYLQGKIAFISNEKDKTVFNVILPLKL